VCFLACGTDFSETLTTLCCAGCNKFKSKNLGISEILRRIWSCMMCLQEVTVLQRAGQQCLPVIRHLAMTITVATTAHHTEHIHQDMTTRVTMITRLITANHLPTGVVMPQLPPPAMLLHTLVCYAVFYVASVLVSVTHAQIVLQFAQYWEMLPCFVCVWHCTSVKHICSFVHCARAASINYHFNILLVCD